MWIGVFVFLLAGPAAAETFGLSGARTAQDMQEIVVAVRAVGGIEQVHLDQEQRSIEVQGTAEQLRLAGWMIAALDRPSTVPNEYAIAGPAQESVRIFGLAHASTPQALQELATLIRSIADARYLFVNTARKALVIRGNPWRMSVAGWLLQELDQPAAAPVPAGAREYRLESGNDILPPTDVFVRVFYTRARTAEELNQMCTGMRSAVKNLPRTFVNTARRAIVVRSSADGIAGAEQALRSYGGR